MSYNSIHRYLTDNKLWILISFLLLGWYLSPLFYETFYVPIFDNLDSTVVWYKILAESGKIFAPNSSIIPNMMNGLPRSGFGSEFNLVLWFYYSFEPKTAYIVNEVLIHIIAFFSMFIFLKAYIVKKNCYYKLVPVYVGALYFAILPFWSGAGASIPLLPLVTYSLLNIKHGQDTKWDWLLLIVLPLYTSFIFLYMFYIVMTGIYLVYDTLKNKRINRAFFFAIVLMGTIFLLKEYRLFYTILVDNNFISHRKEFDIFFREDLWETYRLSLVNFLQGHVPHAQTFQQIYLLPITLLAIVLTFFHRRLNIKESFTVWSMVLLSFPSGIWKIILIHRYTLPGIALLSAIAAFREKRYRLLPLLLLLVIILSLLAAMAEYRGLKWITDIFPIFNALNVIRLLFVESMIYVVILVLSIVIFFRKLHFSAVFALVFILLQFNYSYTQSFYQISPREGYASFENYYAPDLFKEIKKDFTENELKKIRFVSYGLEPAVALYNGLYTIDGYSTNYPLNYKHQFKKIFSHYKYSDLFDRWGSKVYIPTVPNQLETYLKIKGLEIEYLRFDPAILCELNTTHLISPYWFKYPQKKQLKFIKRYKGEENSWDVYVYKLDCHSLN